ncbi:hypothetical protein WNZ15_02460 [Roseibium sp. AS2]|uniref:hypothetical protein n=1 Tax=Roseibium sp. AS2 TaxID=3135781 RepID=UPI00316C07C7
MNRELKSAFTLDAIEAIENLKELETLEIAVVDDVMIDCVEGKYIAFLDSVQEGAFRTLNFLWKRRAMSALSHRLAGYLDRYGDEDVRVKRLVVQFLFHTGKRNRLREIFRSDEYAQANDEAISTIRKEIFADASAVEPLKGTFSVAGHHIGVINVQKKAPRTTEQVLREYKKTWETEHRNIRRLVALDGMNSQSLLKLKALKKKSNFGLLNDPAIGDFLRQDFLERDLAYQQVKSDFRISAFDESYYAHSVLDVAFAAKRLVEERLVDVIVELGSGSGDNLFKCFNSIEPEFRPSVEFFGAEFTPEGREAADLIHQVQPDMRFSSVPFNYYEPDFSFIPDLENKKVLFLTNHSIEQIPVLPTELFAKMLEWPRKTYCIHNEPVGWQLISELLQARENGDRAFFDEIKFNMTTSPVKPFNGPSTRFLRRYAKHQVSYNSAWWSYYKDYNKNLVPTLRNLEQEGKLRIARILKNHAGLNPMNASTFVEWESTSDS